MSLSPIEHEESLQIGSVEFISPDEIKVILDTDAPEYVALNLGAPRPFPRINDYVMIPVDEGYLVGQIQWLTVEKSDFPKRRGMQDFGLIDLPYPLRKMSVSPLGMLRQDGPSESDQFVFRRGVNVFPSIGANVVLPSEKQLRSIIESGEKRRVKIGTSPLAGNANVCIDPDKLFGRHLAVLGNTGSGKSCSVAGLIRWSIEAAAEQSKELVNARFVILDPNGEYTRAFDKGDEALKTRVFKMEPDKDEWLLQVPLWLWNSREWCSFSQASAKTQRPTLIQALRNVRNKMETQVSEYSGIRNYLRTIIITIKEEARNGSPWGIFPKPKSFFHKLETFGQSLNSKLNTVDGELYHELKKLCDMVEQLCVSRRGPHPKYDFSSVEVDGLIAVACETLEAFGGTCANLGLINEDTPFPFSSNDFIDSIEATAEMLNTAEYTETLLMRIKGLVSDSRTKPLIENEEIGTLLQWLEQYLGSGKEDSVITIIDLSLVPTEIIHTITAIIARMIFEALQRYRKVNGIALPTVLVMEEAHTFVKRYKDDNENQDIARICCQAFERIAREGRKYGLGLVLSSQRPSELSPTVLSQCNSFLLHRISNDRDQELVNRLVPDNLKGLLRELPSLPSQYAILMGWASELPVLVKMNDLLLQHRPQSDDPDYWDVWRGKNDKGTEVKREKNWKQVADDWQSIDVQDKERLD